MHIDKLDDIVNKYNNIYLSTIKTKPGDVKSNTYVDYNKEINWQNSIFKIGDIIRISKNKNIFARDYDPKNFVLWIHAISDLKSEEIVGTFYKKKIAKTKLKRI